MITWYYAIASVVFVSLLSLIGVFTLSLRQDRLREILLLLVSFAVGALYGDVFIHLLPESVKKLGMSLAVSTYVLGGILLFFVIEKVIRWSQAAVFAERKEVKPIVPLIILVDGVHNLIDGMVIGASYQVSLPIGIATTLAVAFHEIPHEISDFAILIHGGLSIRKALVFNFLSALTAIIGGIISLVLGPVVQAYATILLPVTAGGFIYIAGSDLIPELQRNPRLSVTIRQSVLIVAGMGFMALLLLLE